jgi:transposase
MKEIKKQTPKPQEPHRKGRPTKKTEELIKTIERVAKMGMSNETIAAIAGVNSDTFYDWLNKDQEFSERIKKAKAEGKYALVAKIAQDESWQSKAWMLERQYPDEFGRRDRVELTQKYNDDTQKFLNDLFEKGGYGPKPRAKKAIPKS